MANLPFSCGKMRLVRFTTSNRVRAANRGILSCPFCSALPSTPLWWQPTKDSKQENTSLLTLTTCTPRVRILIASAKPTVPWERNPRDTRTFPSTMGRPRCGTVEVLSPQAVQHSRRLHVRWMKATLSHEQQGIRVLGTPVGHPDFIRHFLGKKSDAHSRLFERIPSVGDLQAAWLLLLYCADCALLSLQRMPRSMTSKCEVLEQGFGHFCAHSA